MNLKNKKHSSNDCFDFRVKKKKNNRAEFDTKQSQKDLIIDLLSFDATFLLVTTKNETENDMTFWHSFKK